MRLASADPQRLASIYLAEQRLIIVIAVVGNYLGLIVENIDEPYLTDDCNFNESIGMMIVDGDNTYCVKCCCVTNLPCDARCSFQGRSWWKGGFRLLLTNDVPDVEGSGALHHTQNHAAICSQMLPPLHLPSVTLNSYSFASSFERKHPRPLFRHLSTAFIYNHIWADILSK